MAPKPAASNQAPTPGLIRDPNLPSTAGDPSEIPVASVRDAVDLSSMASLAKAVMTPPASNADSQPESAPQKPESVQPASVTPKPAAKPVARPVDRSSLRTGSLPVTMKPENFVGMAPEAAAEQCREVVCLFIKPLSGVINLKTYSFSKDEVLLLPKWFAMSHPNEIVIKE